MSNWGTDSSNDENKLDINNQWKVKTKFADDTLRRLKQEADNMSQKFTYIKVNNASFEGCRQWMHKAAATCQEVTTNMESLFKLLPKEHDFEYVAKNNQIKQLTKRVEMQVKHVQNLSAEIQREMQRRYIETKDATTDVSINEKRASSNSSNTIQMQEQRRQEEEAEKAMTEQREMMRVNTDVVQLQEMFEKLSSMVHEQGETIDRIEVNVEAAYDQTEDANKELGSAVEYKGRTNKKKLCLIGFSILVLVLLIMAIVLGIKYG